MDRLFFIVIAVALAYGVGCLGRNRKIGFGWAFGISLINVIIGLIVVLCSEKKTPEELEEKGNPNLEPSVWVAIGFYLLYRKHV